MRHSSNSRPPAPSVAPRSSRLSKLPLAAAAAALCFALPVLLPAQTPPCRPCGGVLTADPASLEAALGATPRLEGEARLYVGWNVDLGTGSPQAAGRAADAVRRGGGVPWLRLVFRVGSPVLENAAALDLELEAAAAIARAAGEKAHFQVLWRPEAAGAPDSETFAKDYGFLFKRASVAITGAHPEARVITQQLAADPEALERFYAEEVAAYVDGVALAPAGEAARAASLEKLAQLDPGRPVVLDALGWPADPQLTLPEAARAAEEGFAIAFFEAPGALSAEALAPLKLLAREFQGDLSLDPHSRPEGGAGAWSFVRGEDLSLRVIARTGPGGSLTLRFPDPQLKQPALVEPATGAVRDLFGLRRSASGLEVDVTEPGTAAILRLERMTAAELEGLEGLDLTLDVTDERQIPVEEILRRLQAFEDAQNRRLDHYRATNTTHLRFQLGTGLGSLEATYEGSFFFRRGEGFDWAWEDFYVNGVRWRDERIPQIPLVQPEKAAAMPLEIHFTKEYVYRLRGTETVDGRDCWAVDFEPAAGVTGESLWQGTVWVDREHSGRVRTRALQVGLEGEVVSNEETVSFRPVDEDGRDAAWTPEALWLPLRVEGQQLWNVLNATIVAESETRLTGLVINGEGFDREREAILASDVTMVRDTAEGLRYLVKDKETGERVVEANPKPNRLFLTGGVFYDESQDYPLPLAGIDYFSFDFRETGKQVNLFFAGPLVIGNVADPDVFGSKWDAGANVFVLAVAGDDTVYVGEEEIEPETVSRLPARLSLFLGRTLGSFGKLDLTYSAAWSNFQRADETAEDFVLPEDHFTHSVAIETRYNRAGYRLAAGGSLNQRSDWEPWGRPGSTTLESFDRDTEEYTLWNVGLAKTWWLPKFQKMGLELEYRDGENLDRFSKYEFGFFSDVRVHGYQSDRVRAESAYAAHLTYGFDLGEVFRLSLIGDAAWATDRESGLEDELLGGVGIEGTFIGPWRTVINLDVGHAVAGPDDGFAALVTVLKLFR